MGLWKMEKFCCWSPISQKMWDAPYWLAFLAPKIPWKHAQNSTFYLHLKTFWSTNNIPIYQFFTKKSQTNKPNQKRFYPSFFVKICIMFCISALKSLCPWCKVNYIWLWKKCLFLGISCLLPGRAQRWV